MSQEISNKIQMLEDNFITTMKGYEDKLSKLKGVESAEQPTEFTTLEREFSQFKASMIKNLCEIKTTLSEIREKSDEMEAYSRKNCLVIHGIKEDPKEAITTVVINFINN